MRKLLLILCLLPAIALANPQMPGCGMQPPPMPIPGELPLPLLLHRLDLTEKQQNEIKNLAKTHCSEIGAKLENIRAIDDKIQRLSFSNDYSDEKIQELFDKAAIVHKEIAMQKSRLENAIFKLLTKEQQEKLQNKKACLE